MKKMKPQATTWKIMEGDVLFKFTKVHHGPYLTLFHTSMSVELPCHPALPVPHTDEPLVPRFFKG